MGKWNDKYFYTSKGRIIPTKESDKALELFEKISEKSMEYLENRYGNSVEKFFYDQTKRMMDSVPFSGYNWKNVKNVMDTLGSWELEFSEGEELKNVGMHGVHTFVDLPGDEIVIPGGAYSIIEALVDQVPHTQTQALVERIDWSEKRCIKLYVKRTRSDGEVENEMITAQHVISTIPLGVIQKNINTLFHPNLDQNKTYALSRMSSGRVSKIFLHFRYPFWAKGEGELIFTRSKSELEEGRDKRDWKFGVHGMNEAYGTRNILEMWVVGDGAEIVDFHLSDADIIKGASELLREFTGDPEIATPYKITRHAWLKDPNILGSWVVPKTNTEKRDISIYETLLDPVPSADNPRLLFAGEHTHPLYYGTMHGARFSGIEQADRIIDHMIKLKEEEYTKSLNADTDSTNYDY